MAEHIIEKSVGDALAPRYKAYALAVIGDRAIPDVNTGLKPSGRKIIWDMYTHGMKSTDPEKKCAKVVGSVLATTYPHGDISLYDALTRLGQNWVMRYPLIDTTTSFGNRDGFKAAAYRYTTCHLSKYGDAVCKDIEKDTVNYMDNFDNTLKEPMTLPSLLPNFLANGTNGIAVSMSTYVPPHNLTEIYDAILFMIDKALKDEDYECSDIAKIIKGPDFPDGGIITSNKEWLKIISEGKGKVILRCKYDIEEDKRHNKIIRITELPYQVNKLKLVNKIDDLRIDNKVEGIREVLDVTKRTENCNIQIKLKKSANPDLVIKHLLSKTDLQISINYNVKALLDGMPKEFGILDCLEQFIIHSMEIVRRRSQYDLTKLNHNILILEGVRKAIENIDKVIHIIREEDNPIQSLQDELDLEEEQAKYVYDMKISRLSKVSEEKVETDLSNMYEQLPHLINLTKDDEVILKQLIEEFTEMKNRYGDERRTAIELEDEIELVDLIKDEELIVTITSDQNIKSVATNEYNKQRRAGKGSKGADTKDDELVVDLFTVNSKDDLLFITNTGRCHTVKAYKIPKVNKSSRGKNLANFVSMEEGEHPIKTLATNLNDKERYLVLVSKKGQVKRLALAQLSNRFNVTKVMGLADDDEVVGALLAKDDEEVMILTANSLSTRFNSNTVRPSGRSARGVKGIKLSEGDEVIGILSMHSNTEVVTVTKYGIAKATKEEEFASKSRGCKGIFCHKVSDKTGPVVSAFILDNANILIATANGKTIRIDANNIAHSSRHTTGTKLINLDKDDYVVAVTCLPEEQIEEIEE